jgi:hypothetical protein
MANRKRNKVRRIAPRSRNAPKPFDDGMQHFMVSVPRQANPIADQAVRNQVADTIQAAVHPQRFTDIEAAKPEAEPTPSAIEAALRKQPAFQELPSETTEHPTDKEYAIAAGQPAPVDEIIAAIEKVAASQPLNELASPSPDYSGWFDIAAPTDIHSEIHATDAEKAMKWPDFRENNGAGEIAAPVVRETKKPGCLVQLVADLVDAIFEGAKLFAKGAIVTAGVLFVSYAMWRYL